MFQSIRKYTTDVRLHGRLINNHLVDTYIPPKSLFRRNVVWIRTKKFLLTLISVGYLKYYTKWKPRPFAEQAQQMYITMNEQLAMGKRPTEIVSEGLIVSMCNKLKPAMRQGKVVWKDYGHTKRPIVVHVALAKAEDTDGVKKFVQATVRIQLKQSVAIFNGKKLVGGNPELITDPVEYIVLERWLEDKEGSWKIKGKITDAPNI